MNEILGARLNTLHNLHYYQELGVRCARRSRPQLRVETAARLLAGRRAIGAAD